MKPSEPYLTCEECRYFDRARDSRGEPNDYGWCRVDPPRFFALEGAIPQMGVWPQVLLLDWCGRGEAE